MPINLFSAETYFYYIYDIYTCRFDIISGRWYFHLEGGIKKSVMGTLLLWIIVLASLEWNASLYDFIFVGIFNKKYFISSQCFPWLCHYLCFFKRNDDNIGTQKLYIWNRQI